MLPLYSIGQLALTKMTSMYTELYQLTSKMRNAALEGRWEEVLHLEQSRHLLFQRLASNGEPQGQEQKKLLAEMLAATDEISALAAAHTAELRERLTRGNVAQQPVSTSGKN